MTETAIKRFQKIKTATTKEEVAVSKDSTITRSQRTFGKSFNDSTYVCLPQDSTIKSRFPVKDASIIIPQTDNCPFHQTQRIYIMKTRIQIQDTISICSQICYV